MIKIHLSRILGEKRISQAEFSRQTGIRPSTINDMYNEIAERVNLSYLDRISRQQHLLLRRNGRRVKKNIKKKRWFKCSTKHETFFTDTFILCLRNKIKCSFT